MKNTTNGKEPLPLGTTQGERTKAEGKKKLHQGESRN